MDRDPVPHGLAAKGTAPPAATTPFDLTLLTAIVLLSAALYVGRLGFYSDDWAFLRSFEFANDRSPVGLFQAVVEGHTVMRPVQNAYLVALYSAFGMSPLGYHLTNLAVLIAGVNLLHLVLRELGFSRVLAATIPLIYGLLPHYATDRFWVAAFQATLSMALYFLSLFGLLKALRNPGPRGWMWNGLSLASLAGSGLAYEVFLPLFVLNPLLCWLPLPRTTMAEADTRAARGYRSRTIITLSQAAVFLTLSTFKALTTTRMGSDQISFAQHLLGILRNLISLKLDEHLYGLNIWRALDVSFIDYGVRFPVVVARALTDYSSPATIAVGGITALLVFFWMCRLLRERNAWPQERWIWAKLMGTGCALFWLGYAVFLTNYNVQFTMAGVGNRTSIAAAVGVAFCFAGAAGFLCSFLPLRARLGTFATVVALNAGGSSLIINAIASFWITAQARESEILAGIRGQLPVLQPHSTVIFDGFRPYEGPAIIFEANWDTTGALTILYEDNSLQADIVTQMFKVEPAGVSTSVYNIPAFYPYGENLLIYNHRLRLVRTLTDEQTARRYFEETQSSESERPAGLAGIGVPIF